MFVSFHFRGETKTFNTIHCKKPYITMCEDKNKLRSLYFNEEFITHWNMSSEDLNNANELISQKLHLPFFTHNITLTDHWNDFLDDFDGWEI